MKKQKIVKKRAMRSASKKRPVTIHWWVAHHSLVVSAIFAFILLFSFIKSPTYTTFAGGVMSDYFSYPDGLVTNEYAYWNSGESGIAASSIWNMTSGSLFAQGNTGWTGIPDSCSGGDPNINSSNCTNSDVFRLNTKQFFSGDVKVSMRLRQNTDIHSASCSTSDSCWHGTHIWLRYQSQYNLYYASINRADGNIVIKRKVPCGPDNSGTYITLASVYHNWTVGSWRQYSTSATTNADGSVTIRVYDDSSSSSPVATGTDVGGNNPNWSASCTTPGHGSSAAYAPITSSGAVGVRGDYANFNFDDFQVSSVASVATTPITSVAPTTQTTQNTNTSQATPPSSTPQKQNTATASTTPAPVSGVQNNAVVHESTESPVAPSKRRENLPVYSKLASVLTNYRTLVLVTTGTIMVSSLLTVAGMWLVRYEKHHWILKHTKHKNHRRRLLGSK